MRNYLVIFIFLMSLSAFSQKPDNRGYRVDVGDKAPKISLKLMDGTPVTNESLKGKVVVLQFTASWCVVCRKEMPHLEKDVWQRFKNDDFILIGVDLKETPEKVEKFIKDMGTSYPVAIDHDGSLFESFTLPRAGVTRNIVLDKNGNIIFLTRLFEQKEFDAMIERIALELEQS